MTVEGYAKLYGKSVRTIKRYRSLGLPLDDEPRMRQIIATMNSRLGCRKLLPKSPIVTVETEPEYEFDQTIHDLVCIHFECVKLGWNDADLRARLKPIFNITRPYVEEPED